MAGKPIHSRDGIVKKSNALARAAWTVKSIYEPRLIALVASKVRTDDKDFQTYEIPLVDITGESQDGRTYQLVAEAVDNLLGKIITIKTETGWVKYVIFSKCEYNKTRACVIARFDPDLKEHYLGLSGVFTKYSLAEFLQLPSIYSQRIFEILKSWDDRSEKVMTLELLFELLDVPESLKKNFKDFRRRVLEKAHSDIHKLTSLKYEWESIKKGKSVVSIRFTFFGKKKIEATKKRVEVDSAKDSKRKNDTFQRMIKCYQSSDPCRFVEKSQECLLCRQFNKSK